MEKINIYLSISSYIFVNKNKVKIDKFEYEEYK